MKSSIYIIGYCCIALGLASCSKEEAVVEEVSVNRLQYMEFTADVGSDTRMQLVEGNKVEWQAGDAISVFDGTGNRLFTTKDSGPTAVFTGQAVQASAYFALYPYQLGATIEGNVLKNVTLPSTQTAKAGSFEAGFNLTVASASAEKMQFDFKNVISLVKFSVSNDRASEVRSVKLTSHDANVVLAGTVDINISDQPTVVLKSEQQSSITLNAPNGLEVGKNYYFSVLPGTLSKGFTLTFANSEGKTWQKSTDASLTTERSNIVNLKSIEIGTFTKALLTNANLIAAAETCSGQSFTKNTDGTVSLLNPTNLQIVQSIDSLDLSGKNDPTICNEIGLFTSLKKLYCYYNCIENLDLSLNLALEELDCDGILYNPYYDDRGLVQYKKAQGLKMLNITKNTELRFLSCSNNQLENLDLSNNTKLQYVYAERNELVSVNVTKCSELKRLDLWINKITSLDVSKNTLLEYLVCSQNKIATLDVTQNIMLKTLYSGANDFTSLNVSKNTQLRTLFCDYSLITEIDLSKNLELRVFCCNVSNITALDVSHNLELIELSCPTSLLTELDLSSNTKLKKLECFSNKLTSLDLSHNPNLIFLTCCYNHISNMDISKNSMLSLNNTYVGSQHDTSMTLYVSENQYNSGSLGGIDYLGNANDNVTVLIKSVATHEGYNETNYGG